VISIAKFKKCGRLIFQDDEEIMIFQDDEEIMIFQDDVCGIYQGCGSTSSS
jgi:hypothetical protein